MLVKQVKKLRRISEQISDEEFEAFKSKEYIRIANKQNSVNDFHIFDGIFYTYIKFFLLNLIVYCKPQIFFAMMNIPAFINKR